MAQLQGLPDWQPQGQGEGLAAGVRQPQVQVAPGQEWQVQGVVCSFMGVSVGTRTGYGPRREFWETHDPES